MPTLGCEAKKHNVEFVHDIRSETAREFADRGLIRHPGFKPDPTQPSPRQRIVHLNTELFIAKLEPDLQEQ